MAVESQFIRGYLLACESVCVMVSEQFREDVSTVPGVFAVLLVGSAAVLVVRSLSVTMFVGFWMLVVGLWIVYLLYRLVVAVETIAGENTRS